uniref:Uncharacterized protein n=1 Tax=uncultured planctomycete 3FN TaxID=455066 RepID=A9LGX1_9BACT|nr:hypothetical protein 3FN_19 [uncultured planctomycete 3FN]
MNPIQSLAENDSRSPHWRTGSFIDVLHEQHEWDVNEYWKLESALYAVAPNARRRADASAFRTFSYIMLTFSCHFDPSDGYSIRNLSTDDIYAYRERAQLVFEGYFANELPEKDAFELVNPLLPS